MRTVKEAYSIFFSKVKEKLSENGRIHPSVFLTQTSARSPLLVSVHDTQHELGESARAFWEPAEVQSPENALAGTSFNFRISAALFSFLTSWIYLSLNGSWEGRVFYFMPLPSEADISIQAKLMNSFGTIAGTEEWFFLANVQGEDSDGGLYFDNNSERLFIVDSENSCEQLPVSLADLIAALSPDEPL